MVLQEKIQNSENNIVSKNEFMDIVIDIKHMADGDHCPKESVSNVRQKWLNEQTPSILKNVWYTCRAVYVFVSHYG